MRTEMLERPQAAEEVAAIVQVASEGGEPGPAAPGEGAGEPFLLDRARKLAEPLLQGQQLDTGESALAHVEGEVAILRGIGASDALLAAVYLVYAAEHLSRPEEALRKTFGESYARLVSTTRKLVQVERQARAARLGAEQRHEQTERVRKMVLAFSKDLRVVLLRLASRLQTLRYHAASRVPAPAEMARESLQVFAPLANRLGIWQLKWEIEDLSFRFLEPRAYADIARRLDEKRVERERRVEQARADVQALLASHGIVAEVQGRPKHLYSIWKKMQGKQLAFEQVFDLRALRVIVPDVAACYAALGIVHGAYRALEEEFDDYIARPKPNGYQSLHTVVADATGRTMEIQIRTRAMHEHAEHGVAAHWAYKEAGAKGYAGVSAQGSFESHIAQARKEVLRQLLAWEQDFSATGPDGRPAGAEALFADRIFVFTPDAAVVELPAGATPVDLAYSVHTELGHRCRGARVDGAMVPLNTTLRSGQTVEIIASKEGGPSLDWLNPDLGFLASHRARAKVRAWFNQLAQQETITRGREAVARLLQREGKTSQKLDELAARLGFRSAEALFDVVGKDEYSLRNIEALLRPPPPLPNPDEEVALRTPRVPSHSTAGGVLVVGVESLMTQLARCCRPAPPDPISGFVTRGRGVSVHREDCQNFRQMAHAHPQRVLPVQWARTGPAEGAYPVDVHVQAEDRQGLLRDVSDVLAREKMNVVGVHTQSARGVASMIFTIEVAHADRLGPVLREVERVRGVRSARRR